MLDLLAKNRQHLGNLGAGGAALGLKGAVAVTVDDALCDSPIHGGLGIAGDLAAVGEACAVVHGGLAGQPPQHGDELLAGDVAVGHGAVGDTLLHGPGAGGLVPIGAGVGVDAHVTGQDGPHHGAGHVVIGGESAVAHAAEQALFHHVLD